MMTAAPTEAVSTRYTLRPYQREAVDAALASLKGKKDENALLVLPTGCHAKGTRVVMFDLRTKAVEDVVVGDRLMGPDGRARTVMQLCRGREDMYRITPHRGGLPFVVNAGHILSLECTQQSNVASLPSVKQSGQKDYITVAEYMDKAKSWKHLRKLHRSRCVGDHIRDSALPMDPWALGVILGDGCTLNGCVNVCTPDPEIIVGITSFADQNGCEVRVSHKPNNKAATLHIVKPLADRRNRSKKSNVTVLARALGIAEKGAGDKAIPDQYVRGSVYTRREVLAGLMDTDGSLARGGYDYISKSERMAHQVTFIARSLGITAHIASCRKASQSGIPGTYWRVSLSGATEQIPCRVARKRAGPRVQKKNSLRTGFVVEPVGVGDFYGFTLDGDHLYITDDFVVHHNSGKSLVIAALVKELAAPVLVLQPNKEILAQNAEKFRSYGGHCGIYSASAGEKRWSDVTFATIGSVIKKKPLLERFHYVLVDECFPAGTLIDGIPIESIRPGYMVNSLNHKTGKVERRQVVRLFRNEVKGRMLVVTLTDGSSITCTENHPFFVVGNGYVPACELTKCSVLLRHGATETTKELRSMRKGLPSDNKGQDGGVLLTGVCEGIQGEEQGIDGCVLPHLRKADDDTRAPENELQQDRKGILQPGMREKGQVQREAHNHKGVQGSVVHANEGAQSNVDARREGEDDRIEQGQDVPIAWRQWGAHQASTDAPPCDRAANGARHRNGGGEWSTAIPSAPLQSGPCRAGGETCDRGGWQDAQAEEVAILGPQEDNGLEFVGVASVEVYQRASGGGDEEVREDHTVYNFEVEHNNNYFANGVLVHNCHLVNSDGGMYEELINHMDKRVVGLTATPYRLSSGTRPSTFQKYSILKFLTRTNPRIFNRVAYHVQNRVLFDQGHLAKLVYHEVKAINRANLQTNSTGADYTDASLKAEYRASGMPDKVVRVVNRIFEVGRRNCLVFTRYVEEAEYVVRNVPGAAIVTAETNQKERDRVINGFKAGRIKCVCNVGILTTGFDYPELEAVVLARPTRSLSLYYQMIGRCIRPHPQKQDAMVVDMGGNLAQFGKVEDLELREQGGWHVYGLGVDRQLTNVAFGDVIMRPRHGV